MGVDVLQDAKDYLSQQRASAAMLGGSSAQQAAAPLEQQQHQPSTSAAHAQTAHGSQGGGSSSSSRGAGLPAAFDPAVTREAIETFRNDSGLAQQVGYCGRGHEHF